MSAKKARLDADKTAKPIMEIIGYYTGSQGCSKDTYCRRCHSDNDLMSYEIRERPEVYEENRFNKWKEHYRKNGLPEDEDIIRGWMMIQDAMDKDIFDSIDEQLKKNK